MAIPAFTAVASIYDTKSHYRGLSGGDSSTNVIGNVVPQDCGWVNGILCGTLIVTTAAACTALCFAGPAPCFVCVTAALGGAYQFCKDCLPEWIQDLINSFEGGGSSGGGGGLDLCCPIGTSCRCGGRCVNVDGHMRCVGGTCLRPNQECQ